MIELTLEIMWRSSVASTMQHSSLMNSQAIHGSWIVSESKLGENYFHLKLRPSLFADFLFSADSEWFLMRFQVEGQEFNFLSDAQHPVLWAQWIQEGCGVANGIEKFSCAMLLICLLILDFFPFSFPSFQNVCLLTTTQQIKKSPSTATNTLNSEAMLWR